MRPRRKASGEAVIRRRIAANVRRLRGQQQISVIDLCEEIRFDPRVWQRIENGETNVTLRTLVRIANALDVDLRELLA